MERLHNTINEHIRLLKHDPNRDIENVEEKIHRIIMFYNNTIHSTTGIKPIDFRNGTISTNDFPSIRDLMIKNKEKIINKLNRTRENVSIQTGPVYLKDERGGKNHSKFRKVTVTELDNDHVITDRGYKYHKSHIKKKKKYQNRNTSENI